MKNRRVHKKCGRAVLVFRNFEGVYECGGCKKCVYHMDTALKVDRTPQYKDHQTPWAPLKGALWLNSIIERLRDE